MCGRRANTDVLTFKENGAQLFCGVAQAALAGIGDIIAGLPADRAGIRLYGIPALRRLLSPSGSVGSVAARVLGPACRPVRAVLFDKTPTTNWSLAWHQDRTIVVVERKQIDGFGPWTVKRGLPHVAPPFELLAEMITLRIHLDPVTEANAPLLIAPGSHKYGRVSEADVARVVQLCGVVVCTADAGDVWLYATPILHASEAAANPTHRRVLQADFAVGDLPGGLQWLGI
jgi:Phytanoyl-CoA dioxygenase (PhyH)